MPPLEFEFTSRSEVDTERLGRLLAEALHPGTVVSLVGQLGAGKTRLVQAISAALGVNRETVNSPTFVLLQEYEGRIPLYHFDTYRLRDTDEFLELGADELLFGDGVCLIEWGDRVSEALPVDVLRIVIETISASERRMTLQASGPRSAAVVQDVANRLAAT